MALTAVTSDGRSTAVSKTFSTNNGNASNVYEIVSKMSDKVLDVPGASGANGAIIQQWDYNGGGQQKWLLIPVDSQYYRIVNQLSGKVLDITGVSTANGALIQQYDWLGGDNQQWRFVPTGGGYFYIVSKLDGKVLDVTSASTANGAVIEQYDSGGGDNQQWKLAPDGSIPIISGSTQSTAAQTSDGSVSALSILSIAGGNATSYSHTELDYAASAYYDPYTAGFIFDNGADVAGNATSSSGTTPAAVGNSVPAYPWHDYLVESDHWVTAWFLQAGQYYDPFGFTYASSSDGSRDVWFEETGIAVWLVSEYIYLGSTYADQTYVPQDQLQTIPLSDDDNRVYVPSTGIPTFDATVTLLETEMEVLCWTSWSDNGC